MTRQAPCVPSESRGQGVTLVELAIFVALAGLLLAVLLPLAAGSVNRRDIEADRATAAQATESLIGYALMNNRLPAPDALASADGAEDAGAAGSEGLIPFMTVGSNRASGEGRAFRYNVSASAGANLTSSGMTRSELLKRLDTLRTQAPQMTNPRVVIDGATAVNVAFLLVDLGRDGQLDADGNGDQTYDVYERNAAPAGYDDRVIYVLPNDLYRRAFIARYVTFDSVATNLVPSDGALSDAYVRDRLDGTTELVSPNTAGNQANGDSGDPVITPDGRFVAFASYATDLVVGDTNDGDLDIYLRDRAAQRTYRIPTAVNPNGDSQHPAISADGRYVVFDSLATNLVADANGASDIFVYDRATGAIQRVSVDSAGGEANGASTDAVISPDGRYVAFQSAATNLVAADGNVAIDIFVRDRTLGTTTRVSVADNEAESNGDSTAPAISADGNFVAFASAATNLVVLDTNTKQDIFVRDIAGAGTTRVSVKTGGLEAGTGGGARTCLRPTISWDGRYVAFESTFTDLVLLDTNNRLDVFVHDRATTMTTRVSVNSGGQEGNGNSYNSSVSFDGRFVAFVSSATNLIAADANGAWLDVFLHNRENAVTEIEDVSSAEVQGNDDCYGEPPTRTTGPGISGP